MNVDNAQDNTVVWNNSERQNSHFFDKTNKPLATGRKHNTTDTHCSVNQHRDRWTDKGDKRETAGTQQEVGFDIHSRTFQSRGTQIFLIVGLCTDPTSLSQE